MVPTPSNTFLSNLRIGRFGVLFALLTILFGFGLGGLFGVMEAPIKEGLRASALAVRDTVYRGDDAKMQEVLSKSWSYFKRAHMHGGGIGTASLVMVLLVAALRRPSPKARALISWALGLGGLGYSAFWLLAGRIAPGLGGTGAAKEALAFLAFPTAGLLLLGTLGTLLLTGLELFAAPRPTPAGKMGPAELDG